MGDGLLDTNLRAASFTHDYKRLAKQKSMFPHHLQSLSWGHVYLVVTFEIIKSELTLRRSNPAGSRFLTWSASSRLSVGD